MIAVAVVVPAGRARAHILGKLRGACAGEVPEVDPGLLGNVGELDPGIIGRQVSRQVVRDAFHLFAGEVVLGAVAVDEQHHRRRGHQRNSDQRVFDDQLFPACAQLGKRENPTHHFPAAVPGDFGTISITRVSVAMSVIGEVRPFCSPKTKLSRY